jgi:hypothetical protein
MRTRSPKLERTNKYEMFEMHDFNRPLRENKELLKSMEEHGFMPSCPIQCIPNGKDKLLIVSGHHRFDCARRLGIDLYYVIDNSVVDPGRREIAVKPWSVRDYAIARATAGDKDCGFLLEFQKKHKLPMGAAAAIVGGQSASSGNRLKDIKRGTFKVGDMKHAKQVVKITDLCRKLNISFATASAFVSAVSLAIQVPEFDQDQFLHRLQLHSEKIGKRSTMYEYLEEIEALYNYASRIKRMPVKFRALELSRERQVANLK